MLHALRTAAVLLLAPLAVQAQPQPWFLEENPRLMLWESLTGPALRQCVVKPAYFQDFDARWRQFLGELADGNAMRGEVRGAALACYLSASVPARLRVPQPPAAAVAGRWRSASPFSCGAQTVRAELVVELPGTAQLAQWQAGSRPDRALAQAFLTLTDVASGAPLASVQVHGHLDSTYDATFPDVQIGRAQDPANWLQSTWMLRAVVRPDATDRMEASLTMPGACSARVPLVRQGAGQPPAALQCAEQAYRRDLADPAGPAGRCRHFEASAAACGLQAALRRNGLPLDDPDGLARALQASVLRTQSQLASASRRGADSCLQTMTRMVGANVGGPGLMWLIERLNDGIGEMLQDVDPPTRERRMTELAGEVVGVLNRGAQGVPGNAAEVATDLLQCAQAPQDLLIRFSEVQGALRSQAQILQASQRLRTYFDWAELTAEAVRARGAKGGGTDDAGFAACMKQSGNAGKAAPSASERAALRGSWTAVTPDEQARPVPYAKGVSCGPYTQFVDLMFDVPPAWYGRLIPGAPTGAGAVTLEIKSNLAGRTEERDAFGYGGVNLTFAGRAPGAGALEIDFPAFYDGTGRAGVAPVDPRTGRATPLLVDPAGVRLTVLEIQPNLMKARATWNSPCSADLLFHRTRAIRGGPERVR